MLLQSQVLKCVSGLYGFLHILLYSFMDYVYVTKGKYEIFISNRLVTKNNVLCFQVSGYP